MSIRRIKVSGPISLILPLKSVTMATSLGPSTNRKKKARSLIYDKMPTAGQKFDENQSIHPEKNLSQRFIFLNEGVYSTTGLVKGETETRVEIGRHTKYNTKPFPPPFPFLHYTHTYRQPIYLSPLRVAQWAHLCGLGAVA